MPSTFSRFVPPVNFALVEEGVYRAGQPTAINIPFLESLKLKTIVWLAVEEPNEMVLAFADENELTIHHMGLAEGGNPWDPLTEQCVLDALHEVINLSNFPLLISCGMGRHRTGTVVGCLRRLQGWNLAAALEEYRRFTGTRRTRVVNELHIEAFRRESVALPAKEVIPKWLWAALSTE
ncbi:putative tyrosine-protein phosphatase OCA1 [Xylona heveae TC161]|uniref:Putative tyrosine-protein phosphatase OCA1 n=1 Tax=Xylona heveae (strain CBS 132557 / TC161) TaxID=1328760 RepID=A0A165H872_XYLHT|nr:putative tyrosine-protein phosphatase OCA1 [Xylona heveae TC161]KZF23120.1 putative tyrosine-protein phosphatase OCA1 [Xylona heveae TC161]